MDFHLDTMVKPRMVKRWFLDVFRGVQLREAIFEALRKAGQMLWHAEAQGAWLEKRLWSCFEAQLQAK